MCAARSAAVALALTVSLAAAADCAGGTCGEHQDQEEAALLQSRRQVVLERGAEKKKCKKLSQTDPAPCPNVTGGSGAPINTALTCVYNPDCVTGGGVGCFESTGCQYA
jgi:hypothetical protein